MARTTHLVITPSILYFGTSVVVLSTLNGDDTTNLAPTRRHGRSTICSYRYERDKFGAVDWHHIPAEIVRPDRIAECPAHVEAHVVTLRHDPTADLVIVEARAARVHADPQILLDWTR